MTLRRLLLSAIALLSLASPPRVSAWWVPCFVSWEKYLGEAEVIFVASVVQPYITPVIVNGVIFPKVEVEIILRGNVAAGPTQVLAKKFEPSEVAHFLFFGNTRKDSATPYLFSQGSYGIIPLAPDFPVASLHGKSPAEQLRIVFQHRLDALRIGRAVSSGDLSLIPHPTQIAHLETWLELPKCASWQEALRESDCVFVGRPICPEPYEPGSGHEHEPETEYRVRVDAVLSGRSIGPEVRVVGVLDAQEGDEFLIVGKRGAKIASGRIATVIPRAFARLSSARVALPDGSQTPKRRLADVRERTTSLLPNFTLSRGSLERLDDKERLEQFWTWFERRGR